MTNYKLIYFNTKGKAEIIRLIFTVAEVKFEDKRLDQEEWPKLKPSTPSGTLPVLEVDGKQLSGSRPIARLLAERFGLAGSNDFENAEIASIVDVMDDFAKPFMELFFERDEDKKPAIIKNIETQVIPKYFGIIESKIVKNNCNGFIYGSKLTYGDLSVYCLLGYIVVMFSNILDSYPGIAKLKAAVEGLPKVAQWLKDYP